MEVAVAAGEEQTTAEEDKEALGEVDGEGPVPAEEEEEEGGGQDRAQQPPHKL
jgi:hypothetical protein